MYKSGSYFFKITHSFIWNILLLILSSAAVAVFSLLLAIGNGQRVMFFDYFHFPLTFILNWLPVFLAQTLLWCLFGRQWISFLLTGILVLTASAGNYFKLVIRYEPFLASDIPYITTAVGVSGEYNISLNTRLILILICMALIFVFMLLFAKRKPGFASRIIGIVLILASIFPLWKYVYSSEKIYTSNYIVQRDYDREMYKTASKGFLYPFIYSIKEAFFVDPPEGYDSGKTAAFLASYPDRDIPENSKPNIIAIQLEAFSDLRALGIEGISDDVYAYYDRLKKESFSGTLVVNVNGGSTIDTEQCFLTGDYAYYKIRKNTQSFVWYLKNQGYQTVGGHPFYSFYGRQYTNPMLGFEDYRFVGSYNGYPDIEQLKPGRNFSDCFFFDSILSQYIELSESGSHVFSFNVTMQGHSPYDTEEFLFGDNWFEGKSYSLTTDCVINNYLGSLADTQHYLSLMIDALRDREEPVVVVLFGDHKPWLGDDSCVAEELGVNYDLSTQEGFLNYYSTEYLIWANQAAKEQYNLTVGNGPVISTCYLFPLVFKELRIKSCGYANYLLERMDILNVISSRGVVFENGKMTDQLTSAGKDFLQIAEYIQYEHAKG